MGVPWKTVLGADCMRARFLKFFSFLFLASFFLSSCKITVNEGSQNAIDAIESEVYDSSSLEDLSSLTVEDDTGCLVFQTPANPDGTTLHYTLTVDIDGTDYTRELNSDQIIVIRNLTLGKHKVTCKAFKEDSSLYAIGSSDAIFRSGETATLELILQRLPDPVDLTSITASYNGGYQLPSVTPDASSFTITEHYDNSSTNAGNPSNYLVSVPETDFLQKVGSIPITIRHKNKTEIQTSVNVPYKYQPRGTYSNPTLNPNTTSLNYEQGESGQQFKVFPDGIISYSIYNSTSTVSDQVTYQWLKDGAEINGATSSEYTVPTDTAGTFKYKCKVTYTPDETYATSTTPVITYSDEITVTVTSASTDAITSWSDLKNAISAHDETDTPLTLQISGILEANSYIEVTGNVSIVAADSSGATIHRASSFKSNMFSVSGLNASLTLGSNQLPLTLDGKTQGGSQPTASNPLISVTSGGTVYINNAVTLQNNKNSSRAGGAISLTDSTLWMSGGSIKDNTCSSTSNGNGGGGVYLKNSSMIFSGGTISGNTAEKDGGGIYATNNSSITMSGNATISDNTSNSNIANTNDNGGGGIYLNNSSLNMISNAKIIGNTTNARGGGIYNTVSGNVIIWSEEAVPETFPDPDDPDQEMHNKAYGYGNGSTGNGNRIYGYYKVGETGTEQDTLD